MKIKEMEMAISRSDGLSAVDMKRYFDTIYISDECMMMMQC